MSSKWLPEQILGRPLLWCLLALVAGILAACGLRLPMLQAWLIAAFFGAAFLFLLPKRKLWLLMLPAFALGFLLTSFSWARLAAYPLASGDSASIIGRTVGMAAEREDGSYQVRLRLESINGVPVRSADIRLYANGPMPLAGSRLQAEGTSFRAEGYANPGCFDYGDYEARQGIAAQFYCGEELPELLKIGSLLQPANWGLFLRSKFAQAETVLTARQSALVRAVFLGDTSGLDVKLELDMKKTGLWHIFSVSGLHIGYVVLLALALVGKGYQKRKQRFACTVGLLIFYLCLIGFSAPILRASVMALAILVAGLFNEEPDAISTFSLAAICCLLIRPLWLFDAGTQLSFAAMWGLMVLVPVFARLFKHENLFSRIFAVSLAASLATVPLIGFHMNYVSWLGWLLSPLAIPCAGFAVILCFAATPLAIFLPQVAGLLLTGAALCLELLSAAAAALASVPFCASTTGRAAGWSVLVFYLFLLALPWISRQIKKQGWVAALIMAAVLAFSFLPLLRYQLTKPEIASVTFLDVGEGDAAFIRTADGYTMLIDGGGNLRSPGSVGTYAVLPYLGYYGIQHIDVVVSSHPDADHADGLCTVMESMETGTFLYAAGCEQNEIQTALLQAAENASAVCMPVERGDQFQLGRYLTLSVLSPDSQGAANSNDASLLLKLTLAETDLLFTGDVTGSILADLAEEEDISATVVKLPHHGSKTGYDEDFYRAVQAETAILSVGKNSYGHPAQNVIEYWQTHAALLRTDIDGAITVRIDSKGYTVLTAR